MNATSSLTTKRTSRREKSGRNEGNALKSRVWKTIETAGYRRLQSRVLLFENSTSDNPNTVSLGLTLQPPTHSLHAQHTLLHALPSWYYQLGSAKFSFYMFFLQTILLYNPLVESQHTLPMRGCTSLQSQHCALHGLLTDDTPFEQTSSRIYLCRTQNDEHTQIALSRSGR